MKGILVLIDGLGDIPIKQFNGQTPLEAAHTPNLDFLATRGEMGYMYPVRPGFVPESDEALISLFGNEILSSTRGQLEASGTDIKITRGDLAFGVNFGTVDEKGNILDRRAGRNLTSAEASELARSLNKIKLSCKFVIKPTIQHRAVLVFYGGFSDNLSGNDFPYVKGVSVETKKVISCKAFDNEENAIYTANVVNEFLEKAHEVLKNHPVNEERTKKGLYPANYVFARGPGVEIPKVKEYKNWMAVASLPLEKGFAKSSEMRLFSFDYPKLTGVDSYENLYEGLERTCNFSIKALKKNHKNFDYAYIHLNELDCASHDNKPLEKKQMLELVDKILFGFLRKFAPPNKINVVVTSPCLSPCKFKAHSADPVSILFYNNSVPKIKKKNLTKEQEEIVQELGEVIKQNTFRIKGSFLKEGISEGVRFTEKEARKGGLGRILGKDLLKIVGFLK